MGRLGFPGETTIKQAYAAMANDSRFLIQDGVSIFLDDKINFHIPSTTQMRL